jgi:OOP family OmpA-OmpF porin
MRFVLGLFVLLAGLSALFVWGIPERAAAIERQITRAADGVVTGAIHPMDVSVSGRDIHLSGTADSDTELASLIASLDAIDGRRVVTTEDVTILPLADPYETALIKAADGTLALTGTAPSTAQAEVALNGGVFGAEALPLASGAPEGWSRILIAGGEALAPLEEGSFALTGSSAVLSGRAGTPAESKQAREALDALPDGVDPVISITLEDAGIVSFQLTYDAAEGLNVTGTVPESFPPEDMAEALGFDSVEAETETTFGRAAELEPFLETLVPLLTDLDRLTVRWDDGDVTLEGVALPGLDPGYVEGQMAEVLGPAAEIAVTAGAAPDNWVTRTNSASGSGEVAQAGHWLPQYDFEVTKQACADEAAKIQAGRGIEFVTGSANLDGASMRVINEMAGLLLHCTEEAEMRVIIGGHTDSEGDENDNYRLSVERAKAVRDALELRGVPEARMTAMGYGETEPIADNDTEEGRAANRRTTFEWPE